MPKTRLVEGGATTDSVEYTTVRNPIWYLWWLISNSQVHRDLLQPPQIHLFHLSKHLRGNGKSRRNEEEVSTRDPTRSPSEPPGMTSFDLPRGSNLVRWARIPMVAC